MTSDPTTRGYAVFGLNEIARLLRDYDLVGGDEEPLVVGSGRREAPGSPCIVFVETMGRRAAADADQVLAFAVRCRVTLLARFGALDLDDLGEDHPAYDMVGVLGLLVEAARDVGARAASSFRLQ
jgi:hypothetical protein